MSFVEYQVGWNTNSLSLSKNGTLKIPGELVGSATRVKLLADIPGKRIAVIFGNNKLSNSLKLFKNISGTSWYVSIVGALNMFKIPMPAESTVLEYEVKKDEVTGNIIMVIIFIDPLFAHE